MALFVGMCTLAQNTNGDTLVANFDLKPYDGPLANPHKGFTVPSTNRWCLRSAWEYGPGGSKDNQAWNLISYGSGYVGWDTLHKGWGKYDWSYLDDVLETHEKHGLGYALRVFPYASTRGLNNKFKIEKEYDWTPRFIYEDGAKKNYAQLTVDGVEYTLAVPVWDDSVYLKAHKEFAAALAKRYDGDPRIEYIDVRSFGNWGEWQMSGFNGSQIPSPDIQKEMLTYYASIFHKTLLVLPCTGRDGVYEHALSLGITKRDDGLIGTPDRAKILIPAYEANLPTIGENLGPYKTMLEYNDIIPGGYLKWTVDRWKEVVTTGHLTYYVLDQDSNAGYDIYKEHKSTADSLSKVLGYNFRIESAKLLTNLKSSRNTLKITVKNTGVAPCFFDIYMVAEVVDNEGTVLEKLGETIFIPKGSFKDEMSRDFVFDGDTKYQTHNGLSIALSIYESLAAYKNGENPTVRFDNDGLQPNNKLLLPIKYQNGFVDRMSSLSTEIYAENGIIHVANAEGKTVRIYDSKGVLCDRKNADTNDLEIPVANKGVYVAVVENLQYKVVVN